MTFDKHTALLALGCLDGAGMFAAGLYGFVKQGSRIALIAGVACGTILIALLLTSLGACSAVAGLAALVCLYKFNRIREDQNNKTRKMADSMKIRLLSEEDEKFEAASKQIFRALMILSTAVCLACAFAALESPRAGA
eukprot:TRINITY_DN76870_c0_g1_i1.p1 TRINITY_DN76870_c0_g1~~TRINITY_DN76870_c0_g1_i1.p1  ORF type:complete len:138 (-),score=31.73 TRINITY_DN76870_c0_g1_i1:98-511(-)